MYSVTRRIEFDAGHRVWGHEGKCAHLHGHRYVAEVTVECLRSLDSVGRVVDFGVIKDKVGRWVDTYWDHNTLLHPDDPLLGSLSNRDNGRDPYAMRHGNPTAENIAAELFDKSAGLLNGPDLRVVRVRVYETPNCWADYPVKY